MPNQIPIDVTESVKIIDMLGVREHSEGYTVELHRNADDGLIFVAYNEAGSNLTEVDLFDLIDWLKKGDGAIIEGNREGAGCRLILPGIDVGTPAS